MEIPEAIEGTYHAEETIEDDPNLEVTIFKESWNRQVDLKRLIFPGWKQWLNLLTVSILTAPIKPFAIQHATGR